MDRSSFFEWFQVLPFGCEKERRAKGGLAHTKFLQKLPHIFRASFVVFFTFFQGSFVMAKKQEEFDIKNYTLCHYNPDSKVCVYARRSSEKFAEVAYVMDGELLYTNLFSIHQLEENYDIYTKIILNKKK